MGLYSLPDTSIPRLT